VKRCESVSVWTALTHPSRCATLPTGVAYLFFEYGMELGL